MNRGPREQVLVRGVENRVPREQVLVLVGGNETLQVLESESRKVATLVLWPSQSRPIVLMYWFATIAVRAVKATASET